MRDVILYKGQTFNDCFRRYYRTLCYFALRYVGDAEKAEDIVQEVFIRLLEGEMTFGDEEHLKRYLYKAVRNACLNQIKLTGIRSDILEKIQEDQETEAPDFFHGIVRAEIYRQIMEAVDQLPVECGKVFRLAYVDGIENEKIAEQLNLSINTVKSQKNKAKIQLREKLQGLYPLALLFFHLV